MRISDWSSDVCSSDLLLGRLGCLGGQRLHLASHHSEALTGFAGTGRLDGRIQCQQVGLLGNRSEEHTSELQSLMRISYAVFCLKKKKDKNYRVQKQKQQ